MKPDAIPVRPLASQAALSPEAARALFGTDALRGTESVEVVRHGRPLAAVPVRIGEATALTLDRTLELPDARGVRLAGPLGAVDAGEVRHVRSRLVAPAALARAWGIGERATLVLGPLALSVAVENGEPLAAHVELALWQGAGRPETAQWIAGLDLPAGPATPEAAASGGPTVIPRRVVTETDVRQALLQHRTIRIRPDQIVTPAAASLARERGVFSEEG